MIKRIDKGSALTHIEMDANLTELEDSSCTAFVNFDGSTTPPTIKQSLNVSDVVKMSTGIYEVYFSTPMENIAYSISGFAHRTVGHAGMIICISSDMTKIKTVEKVRVETVTTANTIEDSDDTSLVFFGGKN